MKLTIVLLLLNILVATVVFAPQTIQEKVPQISVGGEPVPEIEFWAGGLPSTKQITVALQGCSQTELGPCGDVYRNLVEGASRWQNTLVGFAEM